MEKKNNKHKKEEKEIKKEHCGNEECNCKEVKEECTCNEECSCGDNKLEDKIKNLEEALLRSQAELINYKRRKDEEIKAYLAGNLCRCSGYEGQLRAMEAFIEYRKKGERS